MEKKPNGVYKWHKRFLSFMLILSLSLPGYAGIQSGKVDLQMKSVSVQEVVEEISSQIGIGFLYRGEELKNHMLEEVNFQGMEWEEVVKEILEPLGKTFKVEKDLILIVDKPQSEINSTNEAQEQKTIRGTVTDDQGVPLPGVSVVIKGTSIGVATDIDGNYSLEIDQDETVLVFSFVGMVPQEIKYNGQSVLNVKLITDAETLGEVVVTGLQTIEKGRATGSFTILENEELDRVVSTDFREKLVGASTGVYVDKDNNLVIRGEGSLMTTTKPLIVVDGIPLESSVMNINPNDIDQISVLKDAASASIWGVRAANGVIVITTKRGTKDGKVSISYSGDYSIEDKVDVGDYHRLNASEYAALEFERSLGKGIFRWSPYQGYNQIQKVWMDYVQAGTISLEEAKARVANIGSFDNERQIEDLFYRHKVVKQHNLSLTAGNEKVSHYFSLNYDQTDKELVGNSSDKMNFIGNTDINIAKGVDLQLGVRGTYQNDKNNGDGSAWSMLPYERVLDENGEYVDQNKSIAKEYRDLLESNGFLDWSMNNLRQVRTNDNEQETINFATSAKLTLELLKGLKFTTYGSYETGRVEGRNLYGKDHDAVRSLKNQYTEVDDPVTPEIVDYHMPQKGGLLDLSNTRLVSFAFRNTLQYDFTYDDFRVKLMAGNELYSLKTRFNSNRLFGYDNKTLSSEAIDLASLQAGKVKGYTGTNTSYRYSPMVGETVEKYASYFGTGAVTFKEKYDVFASVRLDQTNMLVNSRKFRNNPSWSVGGKWQLSEESFFSSEWINSLAVKASFGLSGNINKNTGPDITGRIDQSTFLAGLNYLSITNPENPQLGWEKTNVLNLGVDFSMLNNRLHGSVEFYQKNSKDLLSDVKNDPTSGWGSILKNAATVRNRGLDLSLNGRILDNELKWDAGLNFSYNHNEVTSISYTPSASGLYFQTPMKGKPISYIAALRYGGLDANGEPQVMKKGDDTKLPYQAMYSLTIDDHKFMGRSTPPMFGSLSNTFQYKNFTLGILVTYKLGHKVRMPAPDNSFFIDFNPTEWMSEKYRWTKPGDELTKWVPKLDASPGFVSGARINAVKYSDYLVDDGDIIRLKSISLAYDLNKICKKLPVVKGGSIRCSAENVWYWAANRYNLDSDYLANSGFGSPFSLPVRAKYTLSLKLNL